MEYILYPCCKCYFPNGYPISFQLGTAMKDKRNVWTGRAKICPHIHQINRHTPRSLWNLLEILHFHNFYMMHSLSHHLCYRNLQGRKRQTAGAEAAAVGVAWEQMQDL